MAFEAIAAYIDQIEKGFVDRESPEAIAKRLDIPDKAKTIRRYKAAVWDLRDLVGEAKEIRAAKHEAQRDKAVVEIVNTLDAINLGKLRAKQLLEINLGDEFETVTGDKHKLTLGSASVYWPIGLRCWLKWQSWSWSLPGMTPKARKRTP
jgi:hypothetical protein